MKILILICIVLCNLVSTIAQAQIGLQKRAWIKVEDLNSIADYYIDPSSIINRSESRRVLVLSDRKAPTMTKGSVITEMIFKCNQNAENEFYATYAEEYSGSMLSGDLVGGGRYPEAGNFKNVFGSYISVSNMVCSRQ